MKAPAQVPDAFAQAQRVVNSWLEAKGTLQEHPGGFAIAFADGRIAELKSAQLNTKSGVIERWTLREPADAGFFETDLCIGMGGDELVLSCELSVGSEANRVAPLEFLAKTPRVLHELIRLDYSWRVGRTLVEKTTLRFTGQAGGAALSRLMQDDERDLPLVVISEYEGFMLHPNLDSDFVHAVCPLAIVVKVDEAAAWELTRICGVAWSCFHGAVRLYWPGLKLTGTPLQHPLWTADRLLAESESTREASSRVRDAIRRRVFAVSSLTVQEPTLFCTVRDEHSRSVRDVGDFEQIVSHLEKEIEATKAREDSLKLECGRLAADNDNLRVQLDSARRPTRNEKSVEVLPQDSTPPRTVAEAVERARAGLASDLVFGEDVEDGVLSLAEDAGPPEKILRFLNTLAQMVQAHRQGSLGTSIANWLTKRSCETTGESYTILNSAKEKQRRTWDDGSGHRAFFELHMKPSDATSPDRCVRIYFAYDTKRELAVVGWVGRKPGT